jgi:hypothetical protein
MKTVSNTLVDHYLAQLANADKDESRVEMNPSQLQ